jgi:uncharacterized protein with HEPN domain
MDEYDVVLLGDMLDSARTMVRLTVGKVRADLEADHGLLGLALAKLIENIGEAANHVSADTRLRLPTVAWSDVIGMRNRLIHAYRQIDYNVVWLTATQHVPELVTTLEAILLDPDHPTP